MREDPMEVARRCAARAKRRVWWAERGDLEQEAALAALSAARTWDPDTGVPLSAYVWRACSLHLRKYLWRCSAPVSETDHNLNTLRDVHRTQLPSEATGAKYCDRSWYIKNMPERIHNSDIDAFSLFRQKEWECAVRQQLDHLFDKTDMKEAIARVLLYEERPAVVAATFGLSVRDLYAKTKQAKKLASSNALLFNLMKECP